MHFHSGVAALPASPAAEQALRAQTREILETGSSAVLLAGTVLAGEAQLLTAFADARDAEYARIAAKSRDLLARLTREPPDGESAMPAIRQCERGLARLRREMEEITGRDVLGVPRRCTAVEALAVCEREIVERTARLAARQAGEDRG